MFNIVVDKGVDLNKPMRFMQNVHLATLLVAL